MMSEWVTFFLSMLCCQCLERVPGMTNSSCRDSISCYKMLSDHSAFLEAGEPIRRQVPYSDTEVQFRNHAQETSQEELEVTDSGETTGGPNIYIEEACGEPRGQQLVVDFSPQAGDAEVELRNQVYDLESSSLEVTSESEPGLVQARGDHMTRTQYRASRYANGSETEVVIKTHYPEYESSSTVSQGQDTSSAQNETVIDKKMLQEPRGQPQSSPELKLTPQPVVAAVALVKQHPFKDSSAKSNQPITSGDQLWEFQSCFSSPMAVFRRTDPMWVMHKSDKSSVQNDSEIELKSHLYTFVTSSVEDMMVVQKEGEQKPVVKAPLPEPKVTRIPDKESNFPAIHNARNHD